MTDPGATPFPTIDSISIDCRDIGTGPFGIRFDMSDGSFHVIYLNEKQARDLSVALWNKVRSPGETR